MVGSLSVNRDDFDKLKQEMELLKTIVGALKLHNEVLETQNSNLKIKLETFSTDTFPIGSIMLFGGLNAPEGWLLCDGSVVLRDNFKELFQVIGETYGKGDGHKTFSLPDLRGRIAIGQGEANGLTARRLGEQIGSETYNLTIDQLPNHDHSGTTSTEGNHNHSGTTSTEGNHNHSGTTDFANPMEHIRVISQTGIGSDGIHSVGWRGQLARSEYEDYFNTANFANSKHTHNFTADSDGEHEHKFNTENDGEHEHSIPSEGKGQPYSVIQPSLSLNYIIKVKQDR